MTTTLVLSAAQFQQIVDVAGEPLETSGVLLARPATGPDGRSLRLIATGFHPTPEGAYVRRTEDGLTVTPSGYMAALREAERGDAIALWLHTHPGDEADPSPSWHDRAVDSQLAPTFLARTGQDAYGSLILSPRGRDDLAFTGQLSGRWSSRIDRLWVVGHRLRLVRAFDSPLGALPALHDRHVRAFGPDAMAVIGDLKIAIVGAGGTGSAVAEELVRLGVRRLTLIDPKDLTDTNLTRVYGSAPADVGRPKVDVLADHLRAIAEVDVTPVLGTVSQRDVASALNDADLVMGCTDDDAGRVRLSQFAYAHRTPVFDMGVQVDADGAGLVTSIIGRITVVQPGTACLVCRGRVDLTRAVAQEQPPKERERLQAEGYAPALGDVEPAVIAFTTAVAAAAVNELLERLIGYGEDPTPSEVLLRIHDRKTSTNARPGKPGHYCDPSVPVVVGDQEPMWGINWAC